MDDQHLHHRIAKLEVQLERQRVSTRRTAFLSIAAACIALPLASRAVGFVKTEFMPGEPILASEISTNFANLLIAVEGLEDDVDQLETDVAGTNALVGARPVYTNPDTGDRISLHGTYCGKTGTPQTGNLGGYLGTKAQCESVCTSDTAHMCTNDEVLAFVSTGGVMPPDQLWIATGLRASAAGSLNDCEGWTIGNTNAMGASRWQGTYPQFDFCDRLAAIACCD